MNIVHGHVYEERYIYHEIGGMRIVALESYNTGCQTHALQLVTPIIFGLLNTTTLDPKNTTNRILWIKRHITN